jgi:hypothetical protein
VLSARVEQYSFGMALSDLLKALQAARTVEDFSTAYAQLEPVLLERLQSLPPIVDGVDNDHVFCSLTDSLVN